MFRGPNDPCHKNKNNKNPTKISNNKAKNWHIRLLRGLFTNSFAISNPQFGVANIWIYSNIDKLLGQVQTYFTLFTTTTTKPPQKSNKRRLTTEITTFDVDNVTKNQEKIIDLGIYKGSGMGSD